MRGKFKGAYTIRVSILDGVGFRKGFVFIAAAVTGQLCWFRGRTGCASVFGGGGGGRPGLFLTSLCLLAFSPSLVLRPAGPCKLGWHLLRIHTEGVKLFRLLIPAFTVFGSAMNCTKLSLSTHNSASFTLQAPPPYIIMRFNILPAIGGCPTHVPQAVIPLSEIPLVEADEGNEQLSCRGHSGEGSRWDSTDGGTGTDTLLTWHDMTPG